MKSKTITAHIPAREIKKGGKVWTYDAYDAVFHMDEDGKWSREGMGAMLESDVIDICKKAENWPEIRADHFPMYGFHA